MKFSRRTICSIAIALAGCGASLVAYIVFSTWRVEAADASTPVEAEALRDPLHGVVLVPSSGPNPDARTLMNTATSDSLRDAALAIAASASATEHAELAGHLADEAFLGRLDSPDEYQGAYWQLRLGHVLKALGENHAASAHAVLTGLTGVPAFRAHLLRVQLLVRALAFVRPADAVIAGYWQQFAVPGSPLAFDVFEAACVNQSPIALSVLEDMVRDPERDATEKAAWMRQVILPRRYDEPLLMACERLVASDLAKDLRVVLLESLFSYDPAWYVGDDPPRPPAPESASPAARLVLDRIGRKALKETSPSATLRRAIEATLRKSATP